MYSAFEAFRPHFAALARVGYFKVVSRDSSRLGLQFHTLYRILIWMAVIIYNLQHVIRAIQVRQCTEQLVGTLFILLTTLNSFGKQIAFNVRVERVDEIIAVINGETFAPKESYHEHVMSLNAKSMSRLLYMHHLAISICGFLFTVYPLINRALGEPTSAKTQLQIFRYNLEHLIDNLDLKTISSPYIDDDRKHKKLIHKKFVDCVKHYEEIVWLVKEVESIFGEATIVQLVVMLWVICMTVYKIVGLSILSAEFLTLATYLGCMMAQLYIYCYYGTHLKLESELVNDSVYQSSWLLLSPAFRRRLLVLMERCKRSIEPRTAYIIPLSMETYITVLRSSYTLFTILDRK